MILHPTPTCLLCSAALLLFAGCRPVSHSSPPSRSAVPSAPDPLAVVLAVHAGDTRLDADIRRAQHELGSVHGIVYTTPHPPGPARSQDAGLGPGLERLGWLFVAKARVSFDPGFYKLAEQCALALEARAPGSHDALLLRGHVLQNLHRFREAEPLARTLCAERGSPSDFGLLGDVLMEQGRLADAINAYQRMADLRPDSQALVRIAHVRCLKGDLDGALEAAREAARAVSSRDTETFAWMHTRLAAYEFQAGHTEAARAACVRVLTVESNFAPALLLRGRMLLAAHEVEPAIAFLRRAVALNPVPEYQWALADSFRASGRAEEAVKIEQDMLRTGAAEDPRTYSLFLATRHLTPAIARDLAERELTQRADVHTHDALAWALAAGGCWDEADAQSVLALAEGTADARLFLHAAIIAGHRGESAEARRLLDRASRLEHMLLPSERDQLREAEHRLASSDAPRRAALTAGQSSARPPP